MRSSISRPAFLRESCTWRHDLAGHAFARERLGDARVERDLRAAVGDAGPALGAPSASDREVGRRQRHVAERRVR